MKKILVLLCLFIFSYAVFSLPRDGKITYGNGKIFISRNKIKVKQNTHKVIINWAEFGIDPNESVNFDQPNASAIALNKVTGKNPSKILGSLVSNGQVWLLNPNGILFGKNAKVNVGGMVASTMHISNDDFIKGKYTFKDSGKGSVVNNGSITSRSGGYIALIGGRIINNGIIDSPNGQVAMASGKKVTIDVGKIADLTVDGSIVDALVENNQIIKAEGGQVFLTANAVNELTKAVVNNNGAIEAKVVEKKGGKIRLIGKGGIVKVSGSLDASAKDSSNGGFVETSGKIVKIADNTKINTDSKHGKKGKWLIDPTDYTVASSGGDISGSTLSSNLESGDIVIETASAGTENGDITVDDTINWGADTTLTMNAHRDIDINSTISNTGAGNLKLRADKDATYLSTSAGYRPTVNFGPGGLVTMTSGRTDVYYNPVDYTSPTVFAVNINGDLDAWMLVNDIGADGGAGRGLQGIKNNLTGNYALGTDIDASVTSGWDSGNGFVPIGNSSSRFKGKLDGLGHEIKNLFISRNTTDYVGVFGYAESAEFNNIVLSVDITGRNDVGSLLGMNYKGTITNCSVVYNLISSGNSSVSGNSNVGGLAGYNYTSGSIDSSHASATDVTATAAYSGGLIGTNNNNASVTNSYSDSTVSINGINYCGGLIGYSVNSSTVDSCYSDATVVSNNQRVGGLIGTNLNNSTVSNSHTGTASNVYSSNIYVGGLIGYNESDCPVTTCYSESDVTSDSYDVGGLIGYNYINSPVTDSYTTSNSTVISNRTTSYDYVGGLIGYNNDGCDITNCYSEASVTGKYNYIGGLIGYNSRSKITDSHSGNNTVTANVTGGTISDIGGIIGYNYKSDVSGSYSNTPVSVNGSTASVGGLIGYNTTSSNITNSYATGTVNGTSNVGGLIGYNAGASTVSDCYSTSTVNGTGNNCGGLAGENNNSSINNSYSTGDASAANYAGGFVGLQDNYGNISECYSTGDSTASSNYAGGFVGYSRSNSTISKSYSTGNASGNNYVGGFVAYNYNLATITDCYSIGHVSGSSHFNGFLGYNNNGTITKCAWDTDTSGQLSGMQGTAGDVTGFTDAQMKSLSSFTGLSWDIDDSGSTGKVWRIYEGKTYPLLRDFLTPLSITASDVTKTYDKVAYNGGSSAYNPATYDPAQVYGVLGYTGDSQGALNAGSYSITPAGTYSDQSGYDISFVSGNLTINPKELNVTGAIAQDKMYDGSTITNVSGATLSGVIGGDSVSLINSNFGNFTDKNAENNKSVTTSMSIVGIDSGNYSLSQPAGLTADITKKTLTVTGTTAQDKVYDGNTNATISGATLSGVISGDTVVLGDNTTGTFGDKNVGTNKSVTTNMTISGADFSNYTLVQPSGLSANITKRNLTVSASGNNKVYDATTAATVSLGDDRVSGDTLLLSYSSATFSDKNVGVGKAVNVAGISISGADSGNYNYNSTAAATANITKKALTVSATASDKVYDATTAASASLSDDRIVGDSLTLSYGSADFTDKNVGNGKTVNVAGISISGSDSGNYSYNATANAIADITPKSVSVTGAIAQNKVYDGTVVAHITDATLSGIISGDDVTLKNSSYGSFGDKNVGTGKAVSTTMNISGTDSQNYELSQPTGLVANITPKIITITGATAQDKIYDGNTDATISGATLSGVISGDTVVLGNDTTGTFGDKNVGTNKSVSTAMSISGADSGNYSLSQPAGLVADITKKALTVSGAAAQDKIYDGNTDATISGATLSGVISGDTVVLGNDTTGTFGDKNVGTNKSVSTAMSISGADFSNYTLSQPSGLSADITKRNLTVSASGNNKVYDATTAATISLGDDRVSGDTLLLSYNSAAFSDKNVGNGKVVNVSGISISGADSENYNYNSTAAATADITKRELTLGATGNNKVYDGSTVASVNITDDRVSGDDLSVDYDSNFNDKNVGSGKIVSIENIALSGTDSGNYSVVGSLNTNADITPKGLTVTGAQARDKIYDGTKVAKITGATLNGVVSGDDILLDNSMAGSFADKNAEIGKSVSTSMSISGADFGNYTLVQPVGLTADIEKKVITANGSKSYDEKNTANADDFNIYGVIADEDVSLEGTGHLADVEPGRDKPLSDLGSLSLAGADKDNYELSRSLSDFTLTVFGVKKNNIDIEKNDITVATYRDKFSKQTKLFKSTIVDSYLNNNINYQFINNLKNGFIFIPEFSIDIVRGGIKISK